MNKFFLQTFGCRCNQADSAAIRDGLCRRSLQETAAAGEADLIVLNSCTVTGRTDQQVRQAVRKAHRDNPEAHVVVTGCYAEREPETLAALPGVSLVIGNAARDRLAEIVVGEPLDSAGRIIRTPLDSERDYLISPAPPMRGRTRPFVKLQDGCDARCSYCIVPSVRGEGRSARAEDVLQRVGSLISQGYREIVLTGVNLGTYGRKHPGGMRLPDLLARILDLPGLGRLRLSSIEPMHFDREIVRLAARNPAFAPHFHIPLQSGSDRILRLMRRPYTVRRFVELIDFIKSTLPSVGLGTDLLVGFPGETSADFTQTCDVIQGLPLTYLHVFPFSPREGTAAHRMPDQVPGAVVRERAGILRDISRAKNLAFRRLFVGRELGGITLAKEENMGQGVVLTENYIQARVASQELTPNRLISIRIDEATPQLTRATVI